MYIASDGVREGKIHNIKHPEGQTRRARKEHTKSKKNHYARNNIFFKFKQPHGVKQRTGN